MNLVPVQFPSLALSESVPKILILELYLVQTPGYATHLLCQVRYNPGRGLVATSGVEKVVKVWSNFPTHHSQQANITYLF